MRLEPRVGDTLRTATPFKCDTPLHRAGDYLRIELTDESQLQLASDLIRAGSWIIEDEKGKGTA